MHSWWRRVGRLSRSWSFLLADLILLSDAASIDRHQVFIRGVRFANTTVRLSTGKKRELWPRSLVGEIPGLGAWSIEHDSAHTQWRGHSMKLHRALPGETGCSASTLVASKAQTAKADRTGLRSSATDRSRRSNLLLEPRSVGQLGRESSPRWIAVGRQSSQRRPTRKIDAFLPSIFTRILVRGRLRRVGDN